jgi:large subunit ribosomal protein L20
MPKLKTKSGVKKRFKLTATGKIKHGVAGKRHRLMSHNAKYIRQNRGTEVLADADTARVKLWAPYGLKKGADDMPRIKRGVTTRAKHKRILDNAKGYYGRRKNTIRIARQAVEKAGQYAYRDRKVKKRSFRALWIQRINAAVRAEGLTYGQFIHALKLANIDLDRKVLADIAMHEGEAFGAIIAQAKKALESKPAAA